MKAKDSASVHTGRIALITAAIVGVATVGAGMLLHRSPQLSVAPVVEVQPVELADVNIYGQYDGRIRAQHYVEVHARVEGYLQQKHFAEGTHVEKGQTLFTIDRTVYEALAARARAQVNKATVATRKAERDLARIKPLYQQNAASQLDLDNAEAAYNTALADEAVAQADLTQAEITLGYTVVKSPISGYISASKAELGTLVGPGGQSLLAAVVKSDTVTIDFSMTALDYLAGKDRNVNIGLRDSLGSCNAYVTVTKADGRTYPYRGLVDFASPQVDPASGTFQVRAQMPNPAHELLPGEITKVKVLKDVRQGVLEVPRRALVRRQGREYVWILAPDNTAELRSVEAGAEVGENVIIEHGLDAQDFVITTNLGALRNGIKVEPRSKLP